jgi:hypothetical protein
MNIFDLFLLYFLTYCPVYKDNLPQSFFQCMNLPSKKFASLCSYISKSKNEVYTWFYNAGCTSPEPQLKRCKQIFKINLYF